MTPHRLPRGLHYNLLIVTYFLSQSIYIPLCTSSHHSIAAMAKFPEIEGGGSLMLAWQIRNKIVLMVGGGEVSQVMPTSTPSPDLIDTQV